MKNSQHNIMTFSLQIILSNRLFYLFLFIFSGIDLLAQSTDTLLMGEMEPISIKALHIHTRVNKIGDIQGTYIFGGKKSEVISIATTDACVAEKSGRQLLAKVPGVFVYDMEGSNQLHIATRGLDPHRGWELNQRKDGVLINSDMYGYPASHYSIPMEAVEKIELVRGTGSLQYGAQFGGMFNYISKKADESKKISFESINTFGSYDLMSTYNAIGGKISKFKYYAYFAKRSKGGYRDGEQTDYDAQGINIVYDVNKKLAITMDWAKSNYIYKIPGPLTDAMFKTNPRQATRDRNYYSPTIHVPSVSLQWTKSEHTKLLFIASAVLGQRKSLIFDRPATIKDSINAATLQFNNRQVDIDGFNSYTQELRLLQNYKFGHQTHNIVFGVQYMNNHLHRTQLGTGSAGSDFDLSLVNPVWGRDIFFKTNNIALFAENRFQVLSNLALNIGARVERGESKMSGVIIYYPENEIPVSISHNFPLFGANFSYKPFKGREFYGGFSQSYRPMLFKDIIPVSIFEKVDPAITNADGYNMELGFRGEYKMLQWDVTAFILQYNNRFGTLAITDTGGNFYTYRTNIGDSQTKGLEMFIQYIFEPSSISRWTFFTSTSLMDGRYTSGTLRSANTNIGIKGNKIESIPNLITRNGVTYQYNNWSITGLVSHTGDSYADPFNTEAPNTSGSVGVVPAYTLVDLSSSFRINQNLQIKASVNNLTDKSYFTKRPLFYPGPGIWPSDGINVNVTVVVRL